MEFGSLKLGLPGSGERKTLGSVESHRKVHRDGSFKLGILIDIDWNGHIYSLLLCGSASKSRTSLPRRGMPREIIGFLCLYD